MLCERARSGYFDRMARAGRTEPDSVSIWLKLSEEDAAQMAQVLARPEFAGWTRAEWCLEMIQTALGYYTRPRPAAGPDRERAPARSRGPREPKRRRTRAGGGPGDAAPETEPAEPEPPSPRAGARIRRAGARGRRRESRESPYRRPEPVADELEPKSRAECPHPADARDYQSGTCGACGAILWD